MGTKKAVLSILILILVGIASGFYVIRHTNRGIEKLPINQATSRHINTFGSTILSHFHEDDTCSKNLCVFNLPIIQCLIASDKRTQLRDSFQLPRNENDRKTLFNSIEDLLNNYKDNWTTGELDSISLLPERETNAEGNLFTNSARTRLLPSNHDVLRQITADWLGQDQSLRCNPGNNDQLLAVLAAKFNALWANEFASPVSGKFTLSDNSTVKCNFMHKNESFHTSRTDHFTTVYVPFKGNSVGMLFLKPNSNGSTGILAKSLAFESVFGLLENMSSQDILLKIPPLDFCSRIELNASARNREDGTSKTSSIECITQLSQVKINEKGVKIRTVTKHSNRLILAVPPEITFDHPFLFYVVDRVNNIILYSGAVRNPNAI